MVRPSKEPPLAGRESTRSEREQYFLQRERRVGMPTQTPSDWRRYVQLEISAELGSPVMGAQQGGITRLGAGENVQPHKKRIGLAGPAWTRGKMEKPKGVEQRDGHTIHVYTVAQQRRLGVDKYGKKRHH